jgi:hypothetical protein
LPQRAGRTKASAPEVLVSGLWADLLRGCREEKRTSAAKAVKLGSIYGTAEAVPFVQIFSSPETKYVRGFLAVVNAIYGTAEQAAGKCRFCEESGPQRLKPNALHNSYVRPKGRTLHRSEFFRSL